MNDASMAMPPGGAPPTAMGGRSVWSGALTRFFGQMMQPFRSMVSRRNTWEDLARELRRLTPRAIGSIARAAAVVELSRLEGRYWWHLQQHEPRTEPLELRAVLARLALRAGQDEKALREHDRLTRGYEALRDKLSPDRRLMVARRLALLRTALAARSLERGDRHAAVRHTYGALRLRVLSAAEQTDSIRLLLRASEKGAPAQQVYLDHLQDWGEAGAAEVPGALLDFLKARTADAELLSWSERQDAIALLRRIHLAAPWLEWPLLRLAESDLERGAWAPARGKLDLLSRSGGAVHPRVPFLRGQVAYFEERYDDADRHFASALEAGAEVAGVYEFMSVAKANLGEFDAAQELAEKALAAAPRDDYLRLQFANILLCRQRIDDAEAQYRSLLLSLPDDPDVLFGLGKIEELRHHPGDAAPYYERILAGNTTHVAALFSLAMIRARDGDAEAARQALAVIHAADPTHLPTRAELGILLVQDGLANGSFPLRQGLAHLTACEAAHHAGDRVIYWLGRGLAANGDPDGCLARWQPLLAKRFSPELRVQTDTVLFAAALAEARDGQWTSASGRLAQLSVSAEETLPAGLLRDHLDLALAQRAIREDRLVEAAALIDGVLGRLPDHAHALLLRCLLGVRTRELARADLASILASMQEGVEREMLQLIDWLLGRRSAAGTDAATPLWDMAAPQRLPEVLATDPELSLFDAVTRLIRMRRAGTPVEEEDVLAFLDREAALQGRTALAAEELGWFVAHLALSTGPSPAVRERLDALAEIEQGCAPFALALVRLAAGELDAGIAAAEHFIRRESGELAAYFSDVLCHCAFKDLQRASREPLRLQRAHEWITKAAELR